MANRTALLTEDSAGASCPLVAGTVVPSATPGYYLLSSTAISSAPWLLRDGTQAMSGKLTLFTPGTGAPLTAPLYMPSGALLLTPEAGAIERLVDKLYFTISAGTRKPIVLADASLTSGRIPYTTTDGRLLDTNLLQFDPVTAGLTLSGSMYANKIGVGVLPPTLGNTKFAVGTSAGNFAGSYAIAHFVDSSVNATVNYQNTNNSGYTGFDLFSSANLKTATFAWSNSTAGLLPSTLWFMTRVSADMVLGTNTTERVRIRSTGEVQVANLTAGKPVYATTAGALTTTPQGQYLAIATKTADYTLLPTDCVIVGDTSSNNVILTLPTAVGYQGLIFHLKSSSNLNQLSFATTAGQTVDGSTTGVILFPNSIKVVSTGSNWVVI